MKIWVDADACPKQVKEILFRAANRAKVPCTLVANHAMTIPPSKYISRLRVPAGLDVADDEIVRQIQANDLVVTADIPLAAAVVAKQCYALNPRGELYTDDNIKARLSLRNHLTDLREAGVQTKGPASLTAKEIRNFANALDRILQSNCKPE